ncbi:MAG: endonuclease [Leptonema sp. (in: Bacteria)]|nr:endonuclease [Leptonema sp. (in: bacteria)]
MPDYLSRLTTEDIADNYGQGCSANRQFYTHNFNESKKVLRTLFLSVSNRTLYCDCKLIIADRQLSYDKSCGFESKRKINGPTVNWEHIMPASRFGRTLRCWTSRKSRGRRYCQQTDTCFNRMEGDLHNLAPALTEINFDRSNFNYGIIEGEEREYGICDFEVNRRRRIVEPRESIRGDIARSYLYMAWWYGIELTDLEKQIFLQWNQNDPPDETERKLEASRRRLQGNGNPFISGWKNQTF